MAMITKDAITNSILEIKDMISKLEVAEANSPAGSLRYKRYPSGKAVPYYVSGPRGHQRATRIDPADEQFLTQMQRKAFARKVLPELKRALKALEAAFPYEKVSLYSIAAMMGPEFRRCADFFAGDELSLRFNPEFERLEERSNVYEFGPESVETDLGIFRSKNEGYDAMLLTELGVQFKYEASFLIGNRLMNVDFVVNLYWKKQIGIIEHHGMLDDKKYLQRKMEDLQYMMENGYYPGQNLLLISDSKKYGLDLPRIRAQLRAFCLPPEEYARGIL